MDAHMRAGTDDLTPQRVLCMFIYIHTCIYMHARIVCMHISTRTYKIHKLYVYIYIYIYVYNIRREYTHEDSTHIYVLSINHIYE